MQKNERSYSLFKSIDKWNELIEQVDMQLSREVQQVFIDHIMTSLENKKTFPHSRWRVNECCILFIYYLLYNEANRKMSKKFDIPKSTICNIISTVFNHCQSFGDNLYPRSMEELLKLKRIFNKGFSFIRFFPNFY